MFKKYLIFFIILLLTHCSAPGTALLGPAITGAKTGSVYQTSLSYGTGQIIKKLNPSDSFYETDNQKKNTTYSTSYDKKPSILLSYKIDKVEFSELIEPEPLP
tara:strand:+ start:831 stop:1139 length:309 start_codon:yes stop_codon:yes gene_type:complete